MGSKASYLITMMALVATFHGCFKEDHFGRSSRKRITYFTMTDQSARTRIDEDSLAIFIKVDPKADITHLHIDSVALSTFATIEPGKDVAVISPVRNDIR
jgi:hypothetical protein